MSFENRCNKCLKQTYPTVYKVDQDLLIDQYNLIFPKQPWNATFGLDI